MKDDEALSSPKSCLSALQIWVPQLSSGDAGGGQVKERVQQLKCSPNKNTQNVKMMMLIL